MHTRIVSSLVSAVIAVGVLAAQSTPTIKRVPVTRTSAVSGTEMFSQYCAACHGTDGKGGGPASSALKKPPTDLTQIAKRNGGQFPDIKVMEALAARDLVSHGSQEMPIWGDVLKSLDGRDESVVKIRLVNLTNHVKSLQAK